MNRLQQIRGVQTGLFSRVLTARCRSEVTHFVDDGSREMPTSLSCQPGGVAGAGGRLGPREDGSAAMPCVGSCISLDVYTALSIPTMAATVERKWSRSGTRPVPRKATMYPSKSAITALAVSDETAS